MSETARRDTGLVKDYEPLVERMKNDPKDRHVLAAAVACRADYLVTFNSKHFSPQYVGAHELTVIGRLAGSVPGFVSLLRNPQI